ncbi:MAG: FG-GAP-like repeat-containing protein [Fulvivirga sp.]|nr:FG-GAP-like repeat-containing protein [Fulvivirga sp.]
MKIYKALLLLTLLTSQLHGQEIIYENTAGSLGIDHTFGQEVPSGGVSLIDFNQDGLDDITLSTGDGFYNRFFVNTGNGFSEIEIDLPGTDGEAKQIIWADYDNDGDQDLFIAYASSNNFLFRNDGQLNFTDVTEAAGLKREFIPTYGATWGDYDRDGFLDIYMTDRKLNTGGTASNHLFKNNGDGTFTETTHYAAVSDSNKAPHCASFFDFNNDGWEDIYVAQDKYLGNSLFLNNGNGSFSNVSESTRSGLALNAMSVTVGDFDENHYLDIYITNTEEGNKLLRNEGNQKFVEVAENTNTSFYSVGWGALFLDVDNDTDLDLYVSGDYSRDAGPKSILYVKEDSGPYTEMQLPNDNARSFANAWADFDNNGLLDIVVNNSSPDKSAVWYNKTANNNNWVKFSLKGIVSNRDGIGTRIELFFDNHSIVSQKISGYGFLGQNSGNIHFGIGNATSIDSVYIKWPSGHIDVLKNVESNKLHHITEGQYNDFEAKIIKPPVNTICKGDSIRLTANLYGRGMTYSWSDGSTKPYIYVKNSGNYQVHIKNDELGVDFVSGSVSIEVANSAVINPEIEINNVSCYGVADGSISVDPALSTAYSITWTHDLTEKSFTLDNLDKGLYAYTLINKDNGCQILGDVSIFEPDSLGIHYEIDHPISTSALIKISAAGGVAPYEFLWEHNDAKTSEVIVDQNSSYHVEVTDNTNCKKLKSIKVTTIEVINSLESASLLKISVYPNPTKSNLKIESEKSIIEEINLFKLNGQMLFNRAIMSKKASLDVNTLPPGVYLIKVHLRNGQLSTHRMIIE